MLKVMILLFVLSISLTGFTACQSAPESSVMEIFIFGIGRADAILITTENHVMMIDTGENQHGYYIVEHLYSRDIRQIDYLIITHFDSDHVGGAHTIIDNVYVKKIIIPNYSRESGHVERFEAAMERAGITPYILTETLRFTLDGADFIIDPSQLEYFHFPRGFDTSDLEETHEPLPTGDDFSIVVSITHGENSFLFTGDAVAGRLQELLDNNEIMGIDYDFLKVPRHGRHNRNSVPFIHAISPRYAVITGFHPDNIKYYYPQRPTDSRVVLALEDVGAEVFYTMSTGVRVVCDGFSILIGYEEIQGGYHEIRDYF